MHIDSDEVKPVELAMRLIHSSQVVSTSAITGSTPLVVIGLVDSAWRQDNSV